MYVVAVALVLAGQYYWSFRVIDISAFILVLYSFIISFIVAKKGNRSGIFFLISWTIFILAMFVFVLRNLGIYPYNTFSNYELYLGSSIQVILLSIALADRINIYKKEKEKSQEAALRVSRENEKLVKEQNIVLEQKVAERTEELQNTNHQLNDALSNLKDAQMQLVEAEKMASLGQLTAGIAHEINNPINFVKSNVKPLRLDINDLFEIIERYNELHTANHKDISLQLKEIDETQKALDIGFVKEEIQQLIKGIEDGAERTAEIVQGLRTFSRLDEAELKTVNVHDGIESTLVILRNSMPYYITLKKDFRAEGNIDCYPGKLNQVFMNILNNALQAINAKQNKNDEEIIEIATLDTNDDKIEIHIKDTGIGMTEEIKHRIYEPFFTTKEVGEGTGLGMAIVFKIIELHSGKIDIVSSPGKGAEIILTLPHNQLIT
jgi:signal transduction histidine kinase